MSADQRQKLTDEQVVELRALRQEGWKQVQLAERFGISQCQVSLILKRRSRVRLTGETAAQAYSRGYENGFTAALDSMADRAVAE